MKGIEAIYEIIKQENIIYEERNLEKLGSKGIYIKLDGINPLIAIDSSIVNNNTKYISILAEELGHHFTTYGNLLSPSKCYMDKLIKDKKENLARKWAANYLISDEEFVQALLTCITNYFDMCEHFNVTYELLNYKLESILKDEKKYNKIKEKFKLYEVQFNACNI